mmetsp:Transcript_169567/g.300313  ORF Transcript_169567/g.300313 Transcript_169567/m.300313 type:complete len:85 (-) Transcript_169567:759-1013(-)
MMTIQPLCQQHVHPSSIYGVNATEYAQLYDYITDQSGAGSVASKDLVSAWKRGAVLGSTARRQHSSLMKSLRSASGTLDALHNR